MHTYSLYIYIEKHIVIDAWVLGHSAGLAEIMNFDSTSRISVPSALQDFIFTLFTIIRIIKHFINK